MKSKLTIAIIAIFLIVGGYGTFYLYSHSKSLKPVIADNNISNQTSVINISEDGKQLAYEGVSNETALATLKKLIAVETTSSDFGEQVMSINGLTADSSKEFWAFYVNGQMASVGAGSYISSAGDKIEWKLETF